MRFRPGQKLKIIRYEGKIELFPEKDISELKGLLKGINIDFERKEERLEHCRFFWMVGIHCGRSKFSVFFLTFARCSHILMIHKLKSLLGNF
jgi:hypothetical protein